MASVADRWHVVEKPSGRKVRTARYGKGKRWQVRYRDLEGDSRNRSFDRKTDAERFLVELSGQLARGDYVDPRAGRASFDSYAADWLERQSMEPTSMAAVELRIRVHLSPAWGSRGLGTIRAADVQRWLKRLEQESAPGYVRLLFVTFSGIMSAAVEDGLIGRNPCKGGAIKLPGVPAHRVIPWSPDQVQSVLDVVPERYRAVVAVAAGCGLRQGECFGLRVQDVDFLRREIHVRQQIRLVEGRPQAALPKYRRTRTVPLPDWVGKELSRHISDWNPLPGEWSSTPGLGGLLFYSRERKPLNRNYFNTFVWRPALVEVSIPGGRENGMHVLRHTAASTWLERGVNIKAVSEYLGHADPGFTLRVYTHVMPSSGEKARKAMDAAFGEAGRPTNAAPIAGAYLAHETVHGVGN